jgi:hypothetical protein
MVRQPRTSHADDAKRAYRGRMKTYYSDTQFDEILKTFRPAPGFNKCKFRESLERVAWFYHEHKADADEQMTDAQRRDFVRNLGAAARSLHTKMREAGASIRILEAFRQVNIGSANAGPVYVRLRRLQEELEWFGKVSDAAAKAIAPDVGKGGNRSDAALREFILSIRDLYLLAAENSRKPTGWQADSEKGELLRLLQATLRPIGVEMALPALYQAYVRAVKAVSERRSSQAP